MENNTIPPLYPAEVVEVNAHDRMTVEIPCRVGDSVWIIANRGGHEFARPARVIRIEIDDKLRPVIYTKGGFGLWGDKVFPDKLSADSALEMRKHNG